MHALLRWRKEVEKQTAIHLQELIFEKASLEAEIVNAQKNIEHWVGHFNQLNSRNPDVNEVMLLERYLMSLDQKQMNLRKEKSILENRIYDAQLNMEKAVSERKQLEFLQDKHRDAYELDIQRQEQKILDDMVAIRFWQKKQQEANA